PPAVHVPDGRPSVLFVSHDAHPHGAQIFLLRFLRWLRESSDLPFEILLGGEGNLVSEFARLGRVSFYDPPPGPLAGNDPLIRRYRAANTRLIYSNTLVNGRILTGLSPLGCPVVTHVHELGYWMSNRIDAVELRMTREWTTRYVAVSRAVTDAL